MRVKSPDLRYFGLKSGGVRNIGLALFQVWCASCPLYEKVGVGGVGRQRNRLVDNELTRQTPAPNHLANLAQGGLGAGDSGTDIGMS